MPTIVKDRRHSKSQSEMGNKFASCFAHGVVKKTRNDDVDEYSITRLSIEDEHCTEKQSRLWYVEYTYSVARPKVYI